MNGRFRPIHVVSIVVALCAASVLTPVAVNAATGSGVNLVDKINPGSIARVAAKGQLLVGEADPVTGTTAKVSSDGKQLVGDGAGDLSVNMGVQDVPLDSINDLTLSAADTRRPVFSGVGNRKNSITSIIASAEGGTAGSVKLLFIAYVKSNSATGDCEGLSGFGAAERFTIMVPVGDTVNLNFPTPLSWSQYADANDFYCLDIESYGGPSGYTAHFAAFGFKS